MIQHLKPFLPGIILSFVLSIGVSIPALLLGWSLSSAIVPAMILGMIIRLFWHRNESFQLGLALIARFGLQSAIVLLGLRISFDQLALMGWNGAAIMIALVVLTLAFTIWMGRVLKVDSALARLLAAGTSICGASAILAANTVIRGRNEDAIYSIACISLLGTVAVLILPLAGNWLGLSMVQTGLWIGGSVHEIGQVAAAGAQLTPEGLDIATLSKMERVALLAPLMTLWAVFGNKTPIRTIKIRHFLTMPWFLVGFILAMILTSSLKLPPALLTNASDLATFLMLLALGAMGLRSDLRQILACGIRPLLLAVMAWVFISLLGLFLVVWF